jgi:hypothetical protein
MGLMSIVGRSSEEGLQEQSELKEAAILALHLMRGA